MNWRAQLFTCIAALLLVGVAGGLFIRVVTFTIVVDARQTPEAIEDQVRELARAIAANAPLTVLACKVAIREALRPPADRDRARVDELVEACFRSEDYLEGQAAFGDKREPRFRGL